MKFHIFIGLLLISCHGSLGQPEESEDATNTTDTNEKTYLDVFIEIQQLQTLLRSFVCQAQDDDNELFVAPTSCFSQNNFTEEQCKTKRCCYAEEYNADGSPGCFKIQSTGYVYSKLDEFEIFSLDDNRNGRKQSTLETAVAEFIVCVTMTIDSNCRLSFDIFTERQLSNLIRDATNGNNEAVQMFLNFGPSFVTALQTERIITDQQTLTLIGLFGAVPPPPPRCFWYPWGGWSNCQGVCGTGVQTRIRRCQGCVPGTGACQGSCVLKRGCANPIGRICGYWSGWSAYSLCSTTCGLGTIIRTRQCYGAAIGDNGCIGESTQSLSCNDGSNSNGNFLAWTLWTICPVSCGGSTQSRQRLHTCDQPRIEESRACSIQRCCGRLPWSNWSACSVSCRTGFRTRSRLDRCPEIAAEQQTSSCNLGNGNYGEWSPWGACSLTCPGGIQRRGRANPCVTDRDVETRPCGDPGFLSQWSPFGPCSSSCPGGTEVRTRSHSCTNDLFREVRDCGLRDPDFGDWTSFGPCSTSCSGTRMRRQFDPCGGLENLDEQPCGSNAMWSDWSAWGLCSQSCVGGIQTRTRTQPCTGLTEDQTQNCGAIGSWGFYSSWSGCSVSCGGGEQFRSRIHPCPQTLPSGQSGTQRDIRSCSNNICCEFGAWSMWSSCMASCLYGVVSRTQINSCQEISPRNQRRFCFNTGGVFTEWVQWSGCSQTCPGGTRRRSRTQTCLGVIEDQQQICGNSAIFNPWTAWTLCSRTCGGGMQSRGRVSNCDRTVAERQNRECNTDPGSYNTPSSWSTCSSTCTGGSQTRVAIHSCGQPNRIERQNCGFSGTFLPWVPWGACSSSCPGGIRSRFRQHQCTNEANDQTESCGVAGRFLPWSVWTVCSQVCAGGTRTRSRRHTCDGFSSENGDCGRAPFMGDWTLWGQCSRTCGSGLRRRTRIGFCTAEDQVEEMGCATAICCSPQAWQLWGACTASCFRGQQMRQRFSTCSRSTPINTEVRNCNAGDGDTTPWTSWSGCTVTCNGGDQTRSRTNTCSDRPQLQQRGCNNIRCPTWSLWTSWSACSVSCFNGVRTRRRQCIGGVAGVIGCMGDEVQSLVCDIGSGLWSFWGPWTQCSASCGGGVRSRTRTNSCGLDAEIQNVVCNTNPGFIGFWTPWGACTRTCGGGSQSRRRTQTCTGEVDIAQRPCNTGGGWTGWTSWSRCSVTCGGGTYTRRRSHTCGLADETETQFCNTFPGAYLSWSPWSTCAVTCGGGSRSRSRSHTCGLPDEGSSESCGVGLCPYWSGWTEFGACSASCGVGVRVRTRECQAGLIGQIGCRGDFRQELSCEAEQSDNIPWTVFTECSTTCGGGFRTRQRVDPCAPAPEEDVAVCNTDPGSWNPWTAWSQCTRTCGGGTTMRRRSHTCGLADQDQVLVCNNNPGSWSTWSISTECSATCGFGVTSRSRQHSCTDLREDETETCFRNPCAIWGGWTTWGSCSASCGDGESVRTRLCQGGRPGEGFCFTIEVGTVDTRICDAGECCEFNWSGWSACCRTAPRPRPAIQIRFLGNQCGLAWQEFNRTCPPGVRIIEGVPCTRLDLLFEEADTDRNFLEGARTAVVGMIRSRMNEVDP